MENVILKEVKVEPYVLWLFQFYKKDFNSPTSVYRQEWHLHEQYLSRFHLNVTFATNTFKKEKPKNNPKIINQYATKDFIATNNDSKHFSNNSDTEYFIQETVTRIERFF